MLGNHDSASRNTAIEALKAAIELLELKDIEQISIECTSALVAPITI